MPRRRIFRLHVPEELQAWRAWRARIAYHERRYPRDSRTLRAWFAAWDAYHAEQAKARLWPWDKTCWSSGMTPWPKLICTEFWTTGAISRLFTLTKGD